MTVAFDLDGIFIPDIHLEENEHWHPSYNEFRTRRLKPLFKPGAFLEEYFIITGRPIVDHSSTKNWVEEHFFPDNVTLLMNDKDVNGIDNACEFKKNKLIEYSDRIDYYIESDVTQYLDLLVFFRENTQYKIKIYHFDTWISYMFRRMIEDGKS